MIPVIGEQPKVAQLHALLIQAVVRCACGSDTPVIVPGLDRKATCQMCGETYVIQRVDYTVDLETGDATLHQAIAKLTPAPRFRA